MTPRTLVVIAAVASSCSSPAPQGVDAGPPPWKPSVVYRTPAEKNARGLLDRRGLIHAHSVHSHDACDGEPINDAGQYNAPCNADFRRGLCQAQHDFVFLTDHPDSVADVEFPDTLLFDSAQGDALVTHGGQPTANRLKCPDGTAALVMAGVESDRMMPAGIERHVADAGSRKAIYGSDQVAAYLQVKETNAVMLVAHTEDWTADQLTTLPLDGFEIYNLHANSLVNAGTLAEIALAVDRQEFDGLPHPDLFMTAYVKFEDARYLDTWGTALFKGAHRVGTAGTDCHRNTFKSLMQDGERVDSYRRMMLGFSNHVLVRAGADGSWDDRSLKDALRAGRSYVAFEYLGYPVGFDAYATEQTKTVEMGGNASIAEKAKLVAVMPTLQNLDPAATPPTLRGRWLRAIDGGWEVVGDGLAVTPTVPGAYRAEIRIVPRHLTGFIGKRRDFIKDERPWIYGNAIYVTP